MKKFVLNLRLLLGAYVAYDPNIFFFLFRIFGNRKKGRSFITDKTKIVIDGFPRSANTFAFNAFLIAQENEIKQDQVAHHIHKSAQIMHAISHNIPVILLIRDPKDAVLSLKVRQPRYSLGVLLRVYILFHRPLLKKKEKLVVAQFENVTDDFGDVIHRVNSRFDCAFKLYKKEFENHVFDQIKNAADVKREDNPMERVSMPTKEKREKKIQFEKEIDQFKPLLMEAQRIYRQMVSDT